MLLIKPMCGISPGVVTASLQGRSGEKGRSTFFHEEEARGGDLASLPCTPYFLPLISWQRPWAAATALIVAYLTNAGESAKGRLGIIERKGTEKG